MDRLKDMTKKRKEKKNKLENITRKTISRKVKIADETCNIVMEEVNFREVDGEEVILDKILIENTYEGIINTIKSNHSKYNPVPKNITISHSDINTSKKDLEEEEELEEEKEFLEIYDPRWSMESVYLEEASRKQILTSLAMAKHRDLLFNQWGLKGRSSNGRALILNFWDPPGTGKSMAAEAIANHLGHKVYSVNYAELESKYVGETPKNIKEAFRKASEDGAVLIFDEADSFLGKRLTSVNQAADYGVNITRSVMLLELEKFDGVVIFTTNLINNYDEAFKRRILANVEFKLPDEDGREIIWDTHIPKELPVDKSITSRVLSKKYQDISGADIKDIVLYAAVLTLQRESKEIKIEDFDEAYRYVIARYKSSQNIEFTREEITGEQYEEEMKAIDKGCN